MVSDGKNFIRQRICNFAGHELDPSSDTQVEDVLRKRFNIRLPQRRSMNESLSSSISDHEIVALILEYRNME